MKTGYSLLFACVWLAGCGGSLIDFVTSGGGCRAENNFIRGQCPNEQLACGLGYFDRDGLSANGCEGMLLSSAEYTLYAPTMEGVAPMTINEYTITNSITGGWIAVAGPACTPAPATPCNYDLLALQIGISNFRFDSLWWTDGLIELPKPIPVTDDGDGLIIPLGSAFVASFTVENSKRVVSQGTSQQAGLQIKDASLLFTMEGLHLPFGGYTVDSMSILAPSYRI